MSPARPWERLDGEGEAPWAAFEAFRELGPTRALKATAEKVGLSLSTIKRHSRIYKWAPRAQAWDAEVVKREDAATLDEAERIKRAHLRVLAKARDVGEKRLDELLLAQGKAAKAVSVFAAARLLFGAVTAERLAIGEATERIEGSGAWDLAKLSPDELEQLENLRRKAQGEGGGDDER